MSSNATPTSVGRGGMMPGIDTRVPYDHSNAVLSYAGLHTPPQSAHESRRPSCAYTAMSDGSFSGASMHTCSQPPTPIHEVHQSSPQFGHRWSDGMPVGVSAAPAHTRASCPALPAAESLYQNPSFAHPAIYNAGDVGTTDYGSAYHANSMETFGVHMNDESSMRNEWAGAQQLSLLKTTLFAMSNGIPPDAEACALYQRGDTIPPSEEASMLAGYQMSNETVPSSVFQPPQVVMPLQIGPQDSCSMESMTSPTHMDHPGLSCSFDSNSTSCGGWDMVGPTSPTQVCFSPSDEDFMSVKHEEPMTPNQVASLSPQRMPTSVVRSEPRSRRHSRRPRKSHSQGRAWLEYKNTWDFHIRFEGKPWSRDAGGNIVTEETRDPKPHKCLHKDDDGNACGRCFERSEHLKRHMGMHTKERKYPCPLPGCGKRIGRPDNAGDHFKTHLREPKKGKRNKHCEMSFLEACILEAYPEKQAEKMLTNLKKWKVGEDERVRVEKERTRMEEEIRRFER